MRLPYRHSVALLVVHVHADVGVAAAVGGFRPLLHGCGVDKELEGRAGLAHGLDLVILPGVEVYVAHVCLDVARFGFHGHQTRVHELYHVAQGVDGRHEHFLFAVVAEEFDLVGLVDVVRYGVGVVGVARLQHLVGIGLAHLVLDEARYGLSFLVAPGLAQSLPVAVEALLYLAHLFAHGLFGVSLHARVERGVDFQAVGVDVEVGTVLLDIVLHGFAEVEGLAVVGTLHVEVEAYGEVRKPVELGLVGYGSLAEEGFELGAVGKHVVQHHVAALQGVLRIDARVIGRGGLEESYQHGCLLGLELLGRGVEVGLGSRLDAEGVRAEVDGVGIHLEDFLLAAEHLDFGGDNHFLALHHQDAYARNLAQQARRIVGAHPEHVLN